MLPSDNKKPPSSYLPNNFNVSGNDTVNFFRELLQNSPISQEPGHERFFQELANLSSASSSTDALSADSFQVFAEEVRKSFLERADSAVASLQNLITGSVIKNDEK